MGGKLTGLAAHIVKCWSEEVESYSSYGWGMLVTGNGRKWEVPVFCWRFLAAVCLPALEHYVIGFSVGLTSWLSDPEIASPGKFWVLFQECKIRRQSSTDPIC